MNRHVFDDVVLSVVQHATIGVVDNAISESPSYRSTTRSLLSGIQRSPSTSMHCSAVRFRYSAISMLNSQFSKQPKANHKSRGSVRVSGRPYCDRTPAPRKQTKRL